MAAMSLIWAVSTLDDLNRKSHLPGKKIPANITEEFLKIIFPENQLTDF
jgi:hypothetical protein